MKRLYLLRHSKAGQTNKDIREDKDRTLTQKGLEACTLVGKYLVENHTIPQVILSSDATRAQQTVEQTFADLDISNSKTSYHKALYLADPNTILDIINQIDDDVESAMIVGHNPGLHQLALDLSGSGDKLQFRKMKTQFPPRSLVIFDIDTKNWASIAPQSAILKNFHIAK